MQMTVPVSSHAWKKGSQYPSASWMDGNPRKGGGQPVHPHPRRFDHVVVDRGDVAHAVEHVFQATSISSWEWAAKA